MNTHEIILALLTKANLLKRFKLRTFEDLMIIAVSSEDIYNIF